MRREVVISEVLENLDYQNVSPTSQLWQRASRNLDIVLRGFTESGSFRNLQRRRVKLNLVNDEEVLNFFARYSRVYKIPSDFGSMDTIEEGLYTGFFENGLYLCIEKSCRFDGTLDYTIKPDYEDFTWCDADILKIIVLETAIRMKALDEGKGLDYSMSKAVKALSNAKKFNTKRTRPVKFRGF